ncbi:RNA polymerase sigma-70 factor [Wenyingzhuangia sp. 2_MG-2023]|uniref:RNA polymerase sigma-70 factor n=1 Tax=Wenyingzhuangia sp. 2_MG-2023 TaxID=3062639 RepID=UPI0026E14DE2|nr:RNA polymerase sigma-70 factor [Wenyingzhuangia sp. 2_MG-2023]MDO6739019.1 RNA polymerase sigma-70 factor [Wenyingzhuangia sp. 2_MG-2023]
MILENSRFNQFKFVVNTITINYFVNRSANAAAESFNAKIKAFRVQFRGVRNVEFFLFRLKKKFCQDTTFEFDSIDPLLACCYLAVCNHFLFYSFGRLNSQNSLCLMNLILEEISKKNKKVFKNFFDKHYEELVVYANGYLFDKDSSEDIVQEIFIYIWEHASKLNIETSLRGYLYVMVRNRCFNYLKSIKITDNLELLDFNVNLITEYVFNSNPTSEEDKTIVYHQILKIIESLPEKMQQVVKFKFLHNYKYSEIAEELDISVNTVKTQLKRAKNKITEMIIILILLFQVNQY